MSVVKTYPFKTTMIGGRKWDLYKTNVTAKKYYKLLGIIPFLRKIFMSLYELYLISMTWKRSFKKMKTKPLIKG